MEIIIDTGRHCIETGSKKRYEHLIRQYFKAGHLEKEKKIMEREIQSLAYFLENANFSDLRTQYLAIQTTKTSSVLVIPKTLKDMHIKIDDTILYPDWKKNEGLENKAGI